MALTEVQMNEWPQKLREINLLGPQEIIEEHTQGDYWFYTSQARGNFFFTQEKIIFVSGWGFDQIAIPYQNIRSMKKCTVGLFFPTGIKITAINEKGKSQVYKISVLNRKYWIEYLTAKTGVICN